jgi:hypothetical protein
VTGFCQHGNEPSGCIKGGDFIDQIRGYRLISNEAKLYYFQHILTNNFHIKLRVQPKQSTGNSSFSSRVIPLHSVVCALEKFLMKNKQFRNCGVLVPEV